MANNSFDRTILNNLEKEVSGDFNQVQSQADRTLRDFLQSAYSKRDFGPNDNNLAQGIPAYGFVGDGFQIVTVNSTTIGVKPGFGFLGPVTGGDAPASISSNGTPISGLSDLSNYKPVQLNTMQTFAFGGPGGPTTNPSSNPRIDMIEVAYARSVDNSQVRSILNPSTGAFVPTAVNKTLSFNLDGNITPAVNAAIKYVQGPPSSTPPFPTPDLNYMALGYILVQGNNVVNLGPQSIIDSRPLIYPGGVIPVSFTVQITSISSPATVSNVIAPPSIKVGAIKGINGSSIVTVFVCAGSMIPDQLAVPLGIVSGPTVQTLIGGDAGGKTGPSNATNLRLHFTQFVGTGDSVNIAGDPTVRNITQAEADKLGVNGTWTTTPIQVAPATAGGWPSTVPGQDCLTFTIGTLTSGLSPVVFSAPSLVSPDDYPITYYVNMLLQTS